MCAAPRWVLEDLTMIRPRRAGIRRAPWITQGGMTYVGYPGSDEVTVLISHFYECRHFDPETSTCGDYENRPDECRDYPWTDRPDPSLAFPAWCSYQADLGNEPEPIPVHIQAKDDLR